MSSARECSSCHAPLAAEDRFCEQCGARVTLSGEEGLTCATCGAVDSLDDDGFCRVCGARARAAEDHVEIDMGTAAGVSDRGIVHRRNEDAFALALAAQVGVTAVVCDGISSASAANAAAQRAADVAVGRLRVALGEPSQDAGTATAEAIEAARAAVGEVMWTTRAGRQAPSCTLVCALCDARGIVVGSVGDSRAYLVDDAGARRLTVDDSWVEEARAAGLPPIPEAGLGRLAHAVTNWIGPEAPERPPQVVTVPPPAGPARLVLCSDGLWNYLADAAQLGDLIERLPAGAAASAVARALVDFAIARGGRDNVTVVVIDIDPGPGARP